ncbi:MAG: hypothetical protein Q4B15_08535 [Lachnospiraceae bacterium]|nr:hypothetical protein [Lachnospiraceae bacterium]
MQIKKRHPEWVHKIIRTNAGVKESKEIAEILTQKGYPLKPDTISEICKRMGYATNKDIKRICPVCGTEFTQRENERKRISSTKFCSEECRIKNRRKKDNEQKRAAIQRAKAERPVVLEPRKYSDESSKRRAVINGIARKNGMTYGQYVGSQYRVMVRRAPAGYHKAGERNARQ